MLDKTKGTLSQDRLRSYSGELIEHWINRVMDDIKKSHPVAAMTFLVKQGDFNYPDQNDKVIISQYVTELLQSNPKQRRELLKAAAQGSGYEPIGQGLLRYLSELSSSGKAKDATVELIDALAKKGDYDQIGFFIRERAANDSSVEYGVRKIAAASTKNYELLENLVTQYFPRKAGIVIEVLLDGKASQEALDFSVKLAKMSGRTASMLVRQYCLKNVSDRTIAQLKNIHEGAFVVSDLLSLDQPKAFRELCSLGVEFAAQATLGMITKRTNALMGGTNDVSRHDHVISTLVKKLAKEDYLMDAFEKGRVQALHNVFTQAADTGVIDARKVLDTAVHLHHARQQLALREGNFYQALENLNPKAA